MARRSEAGRPTGRYRRFWRDHCVGACMPRLRRLAFVPLLLLFAAPEAASAATVLDTRVAACTPTTVFVPGAGVVDVALQGQKGDWDVELTDAKGREVAAGASPDAQEVASGVVHRGGRADAEGLRRNGHRRGHRHPRGDEDDDRAPQMVSVADPDAGRQGPARRARAGHERARRRQGARRPPARRRGPRRRCEKNGFTYKAVQAARPRPASAAAATLPSGRTSYRRLADYESELKALAAANPTLVRLFGSCRTRPSRAARCWGSRSPRTSPPTTASRAS